MASWASPCHNPADCKNEARWTALDARIVVAARARASWPIAKRSRSRRRRRYAGQRYWARPLPGLRRSARAAAAGRAGAGGARRAIGQGGCSRATAAATGSSTRSTTRASPASRPRSIATTASSCATPTSRPRSAARRPPTSRRPPRSARCEPYLLEELRALDRMRVVVGARAHRLAGVSARAASGWRCRRRPDAAVRPRRPRRFDDGVTLIASLSSEPAEHLHRQAHAADAARDLRAARGLLA